MHVLLRGDSGDRAGTIWSPVLVYQAGTKGWSPRGLPPRHKTAHDVTGKWPQKGSASIRQDTRYMNSMLIHTITYLGK